MRIPVISSRMPSPADVPAIFNRLTEVSDPNYYVLEQVHAPAYVSEHRCRKGGERVMYQSLERRPPRSRGVVQSARAVDPCSEQQSAVMALISRVLMDFHSDWNLLRQEKKGEDWLSAANALLDCYSHEMYDLARAIQGILAEDMECHIRALSADMITTTNICHMVGCDREYLERGDELAERARHSADWFVLRCRIRQRVQVPAR